MQLMSKENLKEKILQKVKTITFCQQAWFSGETLQF